MRNATGIKPLVVSSRILPFVFLDKAQKTRFTCRLANRDIHLGLLANLQWSMISQGNINP